MAVVLRGNLEDFGIADVFQLIGQQQKTGTLELSRESEVVQLHFERGAVVSAAPAGSHEDAALGQMLVRCGLITRERLKSLERECEKSAQRLKTLLVGREGMDHGELSEIEDVLTRDTIFEVLRWPDGSFGFSAGSVKHDKPPESLLGAEQILMDGLRMVDEWQTFADRVPSEDVVFRRVGPFESYRQAARGESRSKLVNAERVFLSINGRLAVRRIIDLSRLGNFEATRILAALRSAGVIEPMERTQASRVRHETPVLRVTPVGFRALVSSVVALALLLVLALAAVRDGATAIPADSYAIARVALAEPRLDFHRRLIRNALDAYRFAEGRWPEQLVGLAAKGYLAEDRLTPLPGHAYYYAHGKAGVVLLVPKH